MGFHAHPPAISTNRYSCPPCKREHTRTHSRTDTCTYKCVAHHSHTHKYFFSHSHTHTHSLPTSFFSFSHSYTHIHTPAPHHDTLSHTLTHSLHLYSLIHTRTHRLPLSRGLLLLGFVLRVSEVGVTFNGRPLFKCQVNQNRLRGAKTKERLGSTCR